MTFDLEGEEEKASGNSGTQGTAAQGWLQAQSSVVAQYCVVVVGVSSVAPSEPAIAWFARIEFASKSRG